MPVTALMGLQWGDEGKGKVVDVLAKDVRMVVRAQGGANAGHTVRVKDQKFVLHLIPSGILYPHVTGVIGHGVVIDPLTLVKEIRALEALDIDLDGRLWISGRAHLVLPVHKALDLAEEAARGASAIGTTGRGIGPAYMDKASRRGVRLGEVVDSDRFQGRITALIEEKNRYLQFLGAEPIDVATAVGEVMEAAHILAPRVTDTVAVIHDALDCGEEVLLEGAQGALLDLDLGSYPYVTSSNCHIGGLLAGSGIPPRAIRRVIGVAKAYCTRVGAGPFPTEALGATGEQIRTRGQEFGSTTGRPRRCGWFDAVLAREAIRTNGITEIALTKTDVLMGQEVIKVGTAYTKDPALDEIVVEGSVLDRAVPQYAELPGFQEDLGAIGRWDDLPDSVLRLIEFLERECGAPISLVSTGPERSQTLLREQ